MCNDCNEIKNNCGCKSKVDLKCTFYDGSTLEPLHILNGMTGEEIVVIINNYLKDLILDLEPEPVVLKNVGTGAELYKGFSEERRHEIKTILEGEGIILTENENTIELKVSKEFIENNSKINIQSIGEGTPVYIGEESNVHKFREIVSSDNSVGINIDENNQINLTVDTPEVDYPVIDGENVKTDSNAIGIYKQLSNKKIQLRSLVSNDIIITEVGDDIKLSLPGGGNNSYDWIIDPTFIRPTTWGDPIRNRKEEITYLSSMTEISPGTYTNGQVVKVANGTTNDPFLSYEEYLLKRIYGTEGIDTNVRPGPYSKVYPSHEFITVRIRSNVNTASQIEVQNTALYIENNSILNYTGGRTYAIDYADLYDLTPVDVNGISLYNIGNYIRGEGVITRTNGFGIIRVKTDETKTRGKGGGFDITGIGGGLKIIEGLNSNLYSPGINSKGLPLYNGGSPVNVGNVQPTVPVIKIIGRPYLWWGCTIAGTKVMIRTFSQVGLELEGNPLTSDPNVKSSLTSSAETFMFQFENNYIGYEKRITVGDPGNTTEENELISYFTPQDTNADNYGFFYKPYEGYSMFKIGDKCNLRLENLSTEPNGFDNAKGANVFDISGSGQLYHLVSFSETGGGGAINLFRNRGTGNQITLINAKTSATRYFNIFKGDGSNNVSTNIENSKINAKYLRNGIGTFSLGTGRSLTVLNDIPIIELLPYADNNADALSRGYPVSALYRDASAIVRQVHP